MATELQLTPDQMQAHFPTGEQIELLVGLE
jgi:hypothetical protein